MLRHRNADYDRTCAQGQVPQQDDGVSCAVYTLKFAMELLAGRRPDEGLQFTTADAHAVRRVMALHLASQDPRRVAADTYTLGPTDLVEPILGPSQTVSDETWNGGQG